MTLSVKQSSSSTFNMFSYSHWSVLLLKRRSRSIQV